MNVNMEHFKNIMYLCPQKNEDALTNVIIMQSEG